ncbi:uncharacterized protein [Argopecten irradians]|uniref:uncharacterized protein n=1 Tax=Argopecten irradians TaxID=31199 RepID=UPI003711C5F6
MANSGYLITVCLVAALAYQVSAQCPQATACINRLGFNISSINGISGDFNVLCSNTSDIVHCYNLLTQCPVYAAYSSLLPGKTQMQSAIKTVCKNQNVLMQGFACVGAKPGFSTEIIGCETQVTQAAGNIDPNNISGAVCGLLDNLLNCVTAMPSIQSCGSDFSNTVSTFEKELLPENCPSGSPKLESWLLFASLAALVSFIVNRL